MEPTILALKSLLYAWPDPHHAARTAAGAAATALGAFAGTFVAAMAAGMLVYRLSQSRQPDQPTKA